MKKTIQWFSLLPLAALFSGCMGDNYEQPNTTVFGSVKDPNGEIIQQDAGSEGSLIEVLELAYPKPDVRKLNLLTGGTFRDKNFFAGKYRFRFSTVNFVPESISIKASSGPVTLGYKHNDETGSDEFDGYDVDLSGETNLEITAEPWCRILDQEIVFNQAKQRVEAKFKVQCTTNDPLEEVGVFCDQSKHVSYSINNWGDSDTRSIAVNQTLAQPKAFSVKMDLSSFQKDTKDGGEDFYIRIGAHSAGQDARWNYGEPVKIRIIKKEVPPRKLGIRWDLFDGCDDNGVQDAAKFAAYKTLWQEGQHKSLGLFYYDDKDYKTGKGCWVATSGPVEDGQTYRYTTFISPGEGKGGVKPVFDISMIPEEGRHMIIGMYVSDATHFERDAYGQIEIGSNAVFDDEELCWIFGQFELRNGWQNLDLSLPEANKTGSADFRPKRVNWFRFYHQHEKVGNTTVKFDEIRFYYKTIIETCESTDGWNSAAALRLEEDDVMEGDGAVATTNAAAGFRLQKTWGRIIVPANMADGHLQFWLYVSDAAAWNASTGQIEISSSGNADQNELNWALPNNLVNGWNLVDVKLSAGTASGGDVDLKNMNFFRIHSDMNAPEGTVTVMVDRIRFYNEGVDTKLMDIE